MKLRLALALIGAWLLGTVFMATAASSSFATVDAVLDAGHRTDFHQRLAPRTAAEERPILRHLAAELNRRLFRLWSRVEVVLALGVVVLLLTARDGSRTIRIVAVLAALLGLGLALYLSPQIQRLGPPLDFVPRPFPPEWADAGRQFFRLHGLYAGLELVKLALLGALLVLTARARREGA